MATETREKLLETAARLFHEQGYAATGIATILRESGSHAGSLYHFFPSKKALLVGVLEQYRRQLRPIVLGSDRGRAESDPIERDLPVCSPGTAKGMVETGCRMGCPIGNLALEVSDTYPEIRPSVDTNFRNWTEGHPELAGRSRRSAARRLRSRSPWPPSR